MDRFFSGFPCGEVDVVTLVFLLKWPELGQRSRCDGYPKIRYFTIYRSLSLKTRVSHKKCFTNVSRKSALQEGCTKVSFKKTFQGARVSHNAFVFVLDKNMFFFTIWTTQLADHKKGRAIGIHFGRLCLWTRGHKWVRGHNPRAGSMAFTGARLVSSSLGNHSTAGGLAQSARLVSRVELPRKHRLKTKTLKHLQSIMVQHERHQHSKFLLC